MIIGNKKIRSLTTLLSALSLVWITLGSSMFAQSSSENVDWNQIDFGKDLSVTGFGGLKAEKLESPEGLVLYSNITSPGTAWGGWKIVHRRAWEGKPLAALGDGKWGVYFEVNADEKDEFSKTIGGQKLFLKIKTGKDKNECEEVELKPIDHNPVTWEKIYIPIKKTGPLNIESVTFQYDKNPEKGIKFRQFNIQKNINGKDKVFEGETKRWKQR